MQAPHRVEKTKNTSLSWTVTMITTFFKCKFVDLDRLCIAISSLIGHVDEK